jgi:hypothetical protein
VPSQPKFSGLHRRQVFHWIAATKDRDGGMTGKLTVEARAEYIECLRGSLERGIWLKTPREPEVLGLGAFSVTLKQPIACFTEWALGQSVSHTRSYGRMGLGFPKSWLLRNGGQPVTYFDQSRRGSFLRTAVRLLKELEGQPRLREELLFLLHYSKRIFRPAGDPKQSSSKKKKTRKKPRGHAPSPRDPYVRFWSKPMPFLEEREWRIVAPPAPSERPVLREGPVGGVPAYHLPYTPGKDLFTLVLPDNQTVNQVLADPLLRDRLFPSGAPHVTVLSLEDAGTF